MADKNEVAADWTGRDLYDLDGNKIGTVEDVRLGDVTGGLQWLVVDTGTPGEQKIFVPAAEVRRAGDRLSAKHTKDRVQNAPKVEDEQVLTQNDESKLCRFYGLQYGATPEGEAEGCDEMTDIRPAG
ncbi:MAG: PRC-barrel domain containing protein [Actinobacteria bacterium]|nr:PRC-barrel domain containing protein [Actinomycetota bacterium]